MSKFKNFVKLFSSYLDLIEDSKTTKNQPEEDFLYGNRPYWLILRCSKCKNKSIPMVNKGVVVPVSPYCRHCGSDRFDLEKRSDIERLDTIYALYYKDLNNVRKEMVSSSPARLDRKIPEIYVSQEPDQALNPELVRNLDNVVPFDKYYTKLK